MDSSGTIHQLCYHLSSVIGSLGPIIVFGYKGILLIFGIFLAYQTQSVKLKQVLCVITDPVALVSSNQEKATFDLVSLVIVLCSFLSADLIIVQEMEDRVKESNYMLQEKSENSKSSGSSQEKPDPGV
ncbi:hypothetical protein RRG08_027631 [Elysia crispata]|uniref:Uncharacterized protein n=1 Tax=Elysia crispata TaxID=231223 RepID=A0AAE1E205_9GAST|nr:hypothetical protein RRG08_027631 [Elysia crispata]